MLAVDGVELAAGLLEAPGIQVGETLIVELVGRLGLLDIGRQIEVLLLRCSRPAGQRRGSDRDDGERQARSLASRELFVTKNMVGLQPFSTAHA